MSKDKTAIHQPHSTCLNKITFSNFYSLQCKTQNVGESIFILYTAAYHREKISAALQQDPYMHSWVQLVPQHADKEPKDLNMCK